MPTRVNVITSPKRERRRRGKLLKVRREFGRRPSKAGQLSLRDIDPLPRSIFRRLSKIYGIPAEKLLPISVPVKSVGEKYYSIIHTIQPKGLPLGKYVRAAGRQHEQLHSALSLISRSDYLVLEGKKSPSDIDHRKTSEAGASISTPVGFSFFGSDSNVAALIFLAVGKVGGLGLPLSALPYGISVAKNARLITTLRGFFRRHGVDGLITLYSSLESFNTKKIKEFEKKAVREGLLYENSGFTKKGIENLKNEFPRAKITKRLEEVQKYRATIVKAMSKTEK